MPGSRSTSPKPGTPPSSGPRAALDALFAEAAGNPLRRALWLDSVDQLLRPCLPPVVAAHARLANVRGDVLVFVVDAPVWHAKLRLATRELVDAARSVGLDVTGLSVKTTLQPLRPIPPVARTAAPMSAAGQLQLEAALALLRSDAPEHEEMRAGEDRTAGRRRVRKTPAGPASEAS
ncbi:MAG: DUF721 domain-containing protein [Lysobacteraceae bacterium]|nr:MAG: DUF721 domain-containing protein [Xanthomonadaceae bacterium]